MKGPSFYFQKMSLTRQILTIILTVLMFFIMFFFVFVSDNIDRTITKQMYELILNRQTPIVGLVVKLKSSFIVTSIISGLPDMRNLISLPSTVSATG